MIEHVHIDLQRVMDGYSVRAAFSTAAPWPDDKTDIVLYHGWIGPTDVEDRTGILESLSEELYNLAPRFRPPAAQPAIPLALPIAQAEVRSA